MSTHTRNVHYYRICIVWYECILFCVKYEMYVPMLISPNQWSKYNKLKCFQYPIPNILILHPSPWKILSVANCQIANSKINTNSYNYLPLQIQKLFFCPVDFQWLPFYFQSNFRSISGHFRSVRVDFRMYSRKVFAI